MTWHSTPSAGVVYNRVGHRVTGPTAPALYDLDARDLPEPEEISVFTHRHPPREGPFVLRPEFADLACRRCGRIDLLAALRRGVPGDVVGPRKRPDAFNTDDHVLVVSARSVAVLDGVAPGKVLAFPLPGDPDYTVIYPTEIFRPPADARRYTPVEPAVPGEPFQVRGRACKKCGRLESTTFRPEWFVAPAGFTLGAASVEVRRTGESLGWLGSEPVARALADAKLSGWWNRRVR